MTSDIDKLAETYRMHRRGLFAVALSVTGCPEQAEDAIHAAFERLCRTGRKVRGDLSGYVFQAVRNAACDMARSVQRQNGLRVSLFEESTSAHAAADDPASDLLTAERIDQLQAAVDDLGAADREVVVMKVFAGLTFDQIAESIGQPAKTVATRYRRALFKLEEKLRGQL